MVDSINPRFVAPTYPYLFLMIFISLQVIFHSRIPYKYFLKIGVYVIIIPILLMNIYHFRRSMTEGYYQHTNHRKGTFYYSKTAQEMNTYFNNMFENKEDVYITVIFDFKKRPHRPSFGRSIFFRERVINNSTFTDFSFTDTQLIDFSPYIPNYVAAYDFSAASLMGTNFTLKFKANQQSKSLIYRTLPPVRNDEELVRETKDVMKRENINSLLVVFYPHANLPVGKNLPYFMSETFYINSETQIDPYIIYEFVRVGSGKIITDKERQRSIYHIKPRFDSCFYLLQFYITHPSIRRSFI